MLVFALKFGALRVHKVNQACQAYQVLRDYRDILETRECTAVKEKLAPLALKVRSDFQEQGASRETKEKEANRATKVIKATEVWKETKEILVLKENVDLLDHQAYQDWKESKDLK